MSKLQEYKKLQKAVSSFADKHKDEIITDGLAEAFKVDSGLKAILINGYTPGFNDGDACTHTQYTITNGDEIIEYVVDSEELSALLLGYEDEWAMEEDLGEKELDLDEALEQLSLPSFDYKISSKVDSILEDLEDILEDAMGTDWQFLAVLQSDGTVKTVSTDYDCGY